jgi:glutathione synthase/RimK-type ligase-like ATP-grasp enzyme
MKALFLQYNHVIKCGKSDNYKGFKSTNEIFTKYLNKHNIDVDFYDYVDITKVSKNFFISDIDIKTYDFIFFGFVSVNTTVAHIILDYIEGFVPYIIYGNFKEYDNKLYELELFHKYNISHIPTIVCYKLTTKIEELVNEFEFPVVVKPIAGSRGNGVVKIDSMKELNKYFTITGEPKLIQKFIPNDGDYRVIVFMNKIVMVSKRKSKEGEFRNNVSLGGIPEIGYVNDEISERIEFMSKNIKSNIIGVDIIINNITGEYHFMEMNSGPHYITFCEICDVDFPKIICDYIHSKIFLDQQVEN